MSDPSDIVIKVILSKSEYTRLLKAAGESKSESESSSEAIVTPGQGQESSELNSDHESESSSCQDGQTCEPVPTPEEEVVLNTTNSNQLPKQAYIDCKPSTSSGNSDNHINSDILLSQVRDKFKVKARKLLRALLENKTFDYDKNGQILISGKLQEGLSLFSLLQVSNYPVKSVKNTSSYFALLENLGLSSHITNPSYFAQKASNNLANSEYSFAWWFITDLNQC